MLFLGETNPTSEGEQESKKLEAKGKTPLEQIKEMATTIGDYVAPKMATVYENLSKAVISIEDSTNALNRSMGGFADQSGELSNNIIDAVSNSRGLSLEFKDGVDLAKGMAGELGRMVNPSREVLENSMQFAKSAGLTMDETGKMVIQFQEFGGNQKDAVTDMSRLGKEARKSGLDAKSFTQEVAKNLKQASLFGFKNGIKDIEEMVKKTKLLGTSIEKLQIKGAAENLLDPEKAMEAAANIQMIGGNIGALGDPFQLLYMGQKDMKKLTDEVLNMSKATFTFDKATGAFTQTTEDMYALRAQAQALGINYEEAANAGKELAKVDFIKSKTKLADKIADEDTQNLVAGLSQISKDGTVSIDIPGFKETFNTLDENLKDPEFINALEEYQKKAQLSDKDLALSQMSLQEKQTAATLEIQQLLLFNMEGTKRTQFLNEQKKIADDTNKALIDAAEKPAKTVSEYMLGLNKAQAIGADVTTKLIEKGLDSETIKTAFKMAEAGMIKGVDSVTDLLTMTAQEIKDKITTDEGTAFDDKNQEKPTEVLKNQEKPTEVIKDAFFPSGGKPIIMSEGQIYKGLVQDEMMVGTGLSKIFEKGNEKTNYLSQMVSQTNNQKNEVSGKIDFGNLTVKIDAPSGVDKSALDQTLNSRQFVTHIMNMVANQKSFYTNQATVEG